LGMQVGLKVARGGVGLEERVGDVIEGAGEKVGAGWLLGLSN
jgi:hypothetical protein